MYFIIKLLKKFLSIINGSNAGWQIFLGAFFGILLGFMPLWPKLSEGPALLGWLVLLLALVINCHLGSVFFFLALGKLMAFALKPLALAVGLSLDPVAQVFAHIPLLHASWLSHTGYLGSTAIGLALAPIVGGVMAYVAKVFREKVRDRLLERKKLVKGAKLAGNGILVRFICWFFDV